MARRCCRAAAAPSITSTRSTIRQSPQLARGVCITSLVWFWACCQSCANSCSASWLLQLAPPEPMQHPTSAGEGGPHSLQSCAASGCCAADPAAGGAPAPKAAAIWLLPAAPPKKSVTGTLLRALGNRSSRVHIVEKRRCGLQEGHTSSSCLHKKCCSLQKDHPSSSCLQRCPLGRAMDVANSQQGCGLRLAHSLELCCMHTLQTPAHTNQMLNLGSA